MKTQELVNWHRKARGELIRVAYLNDEGFFSSIRSRYKDWTRAEVLETEIAFNAKVLTKLQDVRLPDGRPLTKEEVKLLILALKNRMAYASGQSDFYPVYMTFIIFLTTFLVLTLPWLKVALLGTAVVLVALLTWHRIDLRNKVTELQQILNLLDAYKDNHAVGHA